MARGYPDYFGFSMFPYFGAVLTQDQLVTPIVGPDTQTIYEVTHKGVILGGDFLLLTGDSLLTTSIEVTVDGNVIFAQNVYEMVRYGLSRIGSDPISLAAFNIELGEASLQFAREISFGQSFKVEVIVVGANNVAILGKLIYTLIIT